MAQERYCRGDTDELSTAERERLRELEREVADLRMERDLLKRSVAFCVIPEGTGPIKGRFRGVMLFLVGATARRRAGGVKLERPQRSEDERP